MAPEPDPANLERHLRAYRRAAGRHARRVLRYTSPGGRHQSRRPTPDEDLLLREAYDLTGRIGARIEEMDR